LMNHRFGKSEKMEKDSKTADFSPHFIDKPSICTYIYYYF